jgi:hypothetical protein
MSTSCSSIITRSPINTPVELGDKTYQIDIPEASVGCFGNCDIQITSGGVFSAAVLEGNDCSGAELQCEQSMVGNLLLQVDMEESVPKSHTLIISDDDANDFGDFSVSIFCVQACA